MSYIGKIKAKYRREKLFSDGTQAPVDRNDRARLMGLAHKARGDGLITRAAVDILRALLYRFANLKDGRCFPSYIRIADEAKCNPRTVGRCLPDLEAAGLITWVNRIVRVRERGEGLGGMFAPIWRVKRTSNAYDFPQAKKNPVFFSKGQKASESTTQASFSFTSDQLNPENELEAALMSYGRTAKFC